MSETRATTPVFPPGRYGRRRDGRRRWLLPVIFAVLVLALSVLAAVRLYRQYGDPDYDAKIVGWSDVTPARMTIEFTVRVPAGGSAVCVLRARTYDGAEVGRREVTVRPTGSATLVRAAESVPTTALAAVGDVVRCRPPG
ncbi:DUF4307 domain-containing protein [Jidongwangia harbinensis]|uniref:DUF4307 domain-containing protein n=1 Tax=Jidongwangia harbinensis TaxID=2878561 RepID=UPI001CDA309A|nr:DUF4307 domain-containing protein [Jidongwangia harbinensis]MCA2215622.1 DUF4307 domain-containing protein [Jidongwangia harbinensis]